MLRIFFTSLIIALHSSCSFSGFGTEEIVERSKENPPEWVSKASHGSHQIGDVVAFVAAKSRLPDLPLGVKEAQFDALSQSAKELEQGTLKTLSKTASDNQITIVSQTQMQSMTTLVAQDMHGKNAGVSDIYFEKIIDNSTDDSVVYYKVYVKIEYPVTLRNTILGGVADQMMRSPYHDLKQLSQFIKSSSVTGISH